GRRRRPSVPREAGFFPRLRTVSSFASPPAERPRKRHGEDAGQSAAPTDCNRCRGAATIAQRPTGGQRRSGAPGGEGPPGTRRREVTTPSLLRRAPMVALRPHVVEPVDIVLKCTPWRRSARRPALAPRAPRRGP